MGGESNDISSKLGEDSFRDVAKKNSLEVAMKCMNTYCPLQI